MHQKDIRGKNNNSAPLSSGNSNSQQPSFSVLNAAASQGATPEQQLGNTGVMQGGKLIRVRDTRNQFNQL